jgi:hypothetical protein
MTSRSQSAQPVEPRLHQIPRSEFGKDPGQHALLFERDPGFSIVGVAYRHSIRRDFLDGVVGPNDPALAEQNRLLRRIKSVAHPLKQAAGRGTAYLHEAVEAIGVNPVHDLERKFPPLVEHHRPRRSSDIPSGSTTLQIAHVFDRLLGTQSIRSFVGDTAHIEISDRAGSQRAVPSFSRVTECLVPLREMQVYIGIPFRIRTHVALELSNGLLEISLSSPPEAIFQPGQVLRVELADLHCESA